MSKNEDIILEEKINENELPKSKNYKKIKHLTVIIAFTLIIAAVITLSIFNFKVEAIEEKTNPMTRNLVNDISATKTYNLGSFKVREQTVSIKYVIDITNNNFINKIVISTASGSFEFGNTGMSSPGKGSKNYFTQIFKYSFPGAPDIETFGFAAGTLGWEISLESNDKYNIELSGSIGLYAKQRILSEYTVKYCHGFGYLAKAKGKLIASNGSIMKDSDFSLGMGDLIIEYFPPYSIFTTKLFEGWRYI